MASPVPAKSQPLHSFSLPQWKLTKNHTNNHHRGRRTADSSLQQLPPPDAAPRQSPARRQSPLLDSGPRQSPMRDSASESESSHLASFKDSAAPENRNSSVPQSGKNGFLASSSDHIMVKADKQPAASDHDKDGVKDAQSKIYIRLRTNLKNKPDEVQEEGKTNVEGAEVEESVPKTWNLRPRKPLRKQSNANGGNSSGGRLSLPENKAQSPQVVPKRPEMRSAPQQEAAEKKEKKQKFSISLSREEIEEDIYAITGSKPARRPKKRAKIIQRQLDCVFPGLIQNFGLIRL